MPTPLANAIVAWLPVVRAACSAQFGLTIRKLKDRGISILLVEQNVNFATRVADRHYVVEHGEVIDAFSNAEIASQSARLSAYLSV
ncbi:hypothetical protein AZ16_1529 [Bordetella bronchiseptica B18-5 (C3)]|nr:hypothetical protein AZ16_1529 [Bordetella bronchiseptica B18-5 (C3)]